MEWYYYLIAIVGAALAGAINTFAGNGSAITLTILTEMLGLPPNLANGTNRIGIMSQSIAGTYAYHKNDKLNIAAGWKYIVPIVIGAIAGVLVAVWVSNEQFRAVFRFLMVFMLLIILVKPKRWFRETDEANAPPYLLALPFCLALGFYGGFIQMGMGVFFLAITVLFLRFSLTDANALKIFTVGLYTIFVIAIFQWKGLIDWKIGGIMAIGQTFGGYFTAVYAAQNKSAEVWAYRLLVLVVVWSILQQFRVFSYLQTVMGW